MELVKTTYAKDIITALLNGEQWLSYSSISAFKLSPKDFIDYKLRKKEETPAMLYGSMVHCLVLEPHKFNERYFFIDDKEICSHIGGAKPRATNKYKEWYEITVGEAGNRKIIDNDDYQHAAAVANNVKINRASSKALDLCPEREFPIEWTHKNFLFKGFIDGNGEKAIMDLKTMPDAEPKAAQRTIANEWYYLQAAMYLHGLNENKPYYIIAVDKKGGVSVHQLHERLIEYGMKEYETLLDKFNECILTDSFNQSYDFWSQRWDGIFTAEKANYMF